MVRDISGLGGPSTTETRTTNSSLDSQSKTDASTSAQEQPEKSAVKHDDVELSSQVKRLQALTENLSNLPEVNETRVAEIKAALERNEFTINNQRLADKLIDADNLLGN